MYCAKCHKCYELSKRELRRDPEVMYCPFCNSRLSDRPGAIPQPSNIEDHNIHVQTSVADNNDEKIVVDFGHSTQQ